MDKVKILCVIDTQNDFITGSLRNDDAIAVVPNIVKKIDDFDGKYIAVTQDTHAKDYLNTKEGEKLPVEHCIRNSKGWKVEPSIKKALDNAEKRGVDIVYLEKPTFGSDDLVFYLRTRTFVYPESELDVEFVGFCTDICVVSNVLMAKSELYNNAEISVDASCCAGTSVDRHNATLAVLKSCQININNE